MLAPKCVVPLPKSQGVLKQGLGLRRVSPQKGALCLRIATLKPAKPGTCIAVS